jgi:glutaredoxin-like protein NrdH
MATQKQKVKLYSLSTCSHCRRVKNYFKEQGIDYEFQDIDTLPADERDSILSEIRRRNPMCTFPTIFIGDTVIIGFNEAEIRQALGMP